MRVLVSVDMEGIAGVVDSDDIRPGHAEYERNRVLLTAEANAAVRGVFAHDADATVLVTEAHAAFRNLLPERLDRRAELLRFATRRRTSRPPTRCVTSSRCSVPFDQRRAARARGIPRCRRPLTAGGLYRGLMRSLGA